MQSDTYATDGKCHNAQYTSMGHECGKPAVWLGKLRGGWTSGFCDDCRNTGDEARNVAIWSTITPT